MSRSAPEEKAAIEMAQALLGSMAQQPPDLPPPVQATPPPPAAAQQAQPAAQVPRDNVDEIKDDPPPSATSEQKAQSTDAAPPRHRLLQRLLRALPIASPAQLAAMITVFDPNREALLAPPPPPPPPLPKILELRQPNLNPTQEGCHIPLSRHRTLSTTYLPNRHLKG